MTNPRLTRALNDALLLYRTGRVTEACHRAEQIARQNPKDADALCFLGMVQLRLGLIHQAASNLARGNRRRANDPEILTRLAAARMLQGRYEDAEACYERALRTKSNYEPALWGKAELCEKRGRHEEGLAVLQPLLDAGKAGGQVVRVYANLLLQAGRDDEALACAQGALASDRPIKPETRRQLLLVCGKAHERGERYDDAFQCFVEANEADTESFDPRGHARAVDRHIATFTAEKWNSLARSHSASERCVFVVGFPRCGSTLIEQIIAAHPDAVGLGELPALPTLVTGISARFQCRADYPECVGELTRADLDELSENYVAEVESAAGLSAERYVDRMLTNYTNLGLIELMLPGACILHVKRDPIETCLSCFINLQSPVHSYASSLEHLGLTYRQYEGMMAHWRDTLSIPMLEVQYEELVANEETETRRIIDYCGLPWDEGCLRFTDAGQPVSTLSDEEARKPERRAFLKTWTRYEKHLEPLRAALQG